MNKTKISVSELCIFALFGAIMYVSKILMSMIPNVHLVGMMIVTLTLVYRTKALFALYTYIFLDGLMSGFALWWLPYVYVWTILWGAAMLLPKDTIEKKRRLLCACVCAAHGFLFGTLYAPAQAIMYGLDWQGFVDWVIAGLPFDIAHGCGNFVFGFLIIPLANALKRAQRISP